MKKKKITINYVDIVNKIVYTLIATLFSSLVFILKFEKINGLFLRNNSGLYKFFTEIYDSLRPFEISSVILLIFIFYFYFNSFFNKRNSKKQKLFSIFIALVFTVITLIGKSLAIDNTLQTLYTTEAQIVKSILLGIGYFFIYFSVSLNFLSIDFRHVKKKPKTSKVEAIFDKYHVIITVVFIAVCWAPIIISYYPANATGDTLDSLAQYFNVRDLCWSANAINLVNDDVIINKHHSVLFTLILGTIVKFGKWIDSYQLGLFIYNLLQISLLIFCFTFLIHYLCKIRVPKWIVVVSLLFIGFSPIISFYAITTIKDTPGAILIMIYNIFLLQIIRDYNSIIKNKFYIIAFMLVILLILMLKSNSLYIVITSYLGLLLVFVKDKIKLRKLLLIFMLPLLVFLFYDRGVLSYFDVTGTNKKEAYSVQFMQLARLANRNEGLISDKDKEVINKVLSFDAMRDDYDPSLSDSVKNTFNKNITDDDWDDFWRLYRNYFKKYPKLYIASFVNSSYAYFFPEAGETNGVRNIDYRMGENTIFNITHSSDFLNVRDVIELIQDIMVKLPFFALFNHVAFFDWFLIFSVFYIIKERKYKYMVPLISLVAVLSSCLISPVNGSFRYILPIVVSLPLIVAINYLVYKDKVSNF